MFRISKAVEILRKYDRLSNNPDNTRIKKMIVSQLEENGLLKLCIFACPKFDTKALFSKNPEEYMPTKATADLFEPRVTKILSLRKDLMKIGLLTEINVVIGDNDAEEYIFPFMDSFGLNAELFERRKRQYCSSFERRCEKLFGDSNFVVWSLSEYDVSKDNIEPLISRGALQKEIKFFEKLFSVDGPYCGLLNFSREILVEMAKKKYMLYGAQGRFLKVLGGILLQTEGPGVWIERTDMLRCTGSSAIPVIYPWIRKEERI